MKKDRHNFDALYHKSQSLVQVGMHKQAMSLLQKIVKNNKVHSHGHDNEHMSMKDKILKDDYFKKLQDEKEFMSFIHSIP